MDARTHSAVCAMFTIALPLVASSAMATGTFRTTNFVVSAPTAALAQEIGEAAERWRVELAVDWTGKEMPAWSKPCPITAKVAPKMPAGGQTSFVFDGGQVFNWRMEVQGTRERVLDSVLPHEITHTIFACYFRKPLPRWADEGACTTVEHRAEVSKQERLLIQFLKTGKGIPFDRMFAMRDYPPEVLPLYSQGHSLTQFLLARRGKPAFLTFLADGMHDDNWPRAVQEHYGHKNLYELQTVWLDWVREGRPQLTTDTAIAAAQPRPTPESDAPSASVSLVSTQSVYAAKQREAPAERPQAPSAPAYDASRGRGETFLR